MSKHFKALVAREMGENIVRTVEEVGFDFLPQNEVLIRVSYSSLNYKDALSATGNRGVTKSYPHIPGIDASGVVVEDSSGTFMPGFPVLVTGYDLGMNTPGGFGQYIRVPADWVVPLPAEFTLRDSMIFGTAGFTAGIAIYKMLRAGQTPGMGKILVTGATGGVGCMAVAMLSKLGFQVIASTGKPGAGDFLKKLGADEIISREEVDDQTGRPLLKPRWAGAIDNVGGNTLSTAIRACMKEGCVASIGLVASNKIDATVFPFILNGVNLHGVSSASMPMGPRLEIWNHLATDWRPELPEGLSKQICLDALEENIQAILKGEIMGRIVVKHA